MRKIKLLVFYSCLNLVFIGNSNAAESHGMGALLPLTAKAATVLPTSVSASFPTSVDLKQWTMPVGDQGPVSSCTAWAFAYDLMGWYAIKNGDAAQIFAPMYMYSQINNGVDKGSYALDAVNLAIKGGVDTQAHYSHPDTRDWSDLPTQSDKNNAANYKSTSYSELFSSPSGDGYGLVGQQQIQQQLANGIPVAIALRVRPGFDNLSPTVTEDNDTSGTVRGYHMLLAVGYDGQGLTVQNHWGTTWGTNGFGHLSWNVVQKDVYQAYTLNYPKHPNIGPPTNQWLSIVENTAILN